MGDTHDKEQAKQDAAVHTDSQLSLNFRCLAVRKGCAATAHLGTDPALESMASSWGSAAMLRRVLSTLLAGLCLAWVPGLLASDTPKPYFTLHELGPGVWAAISAPGSHAGGNTGFVVGSDGVAVIDTFQTLEAAQALLDTIRKTTPLPIRYVINTHYHLDHVMGNGIFQKAGAVILAQDNVRAWERTENLKFFGADPKPDDKALVAALTLPTITYKDGVTLWLGDRKVIVQVVEGHTGGDSAVLVPDAKVVFTGDLFWNHDLPNLIDADTPQQIATNESFLNDYPDATFVPGHGELGKAADVGAFRDYMVALRKAIGDARAAGKSGQILTDAVLATLKPQYGSWGFFDHFAPLNIEQTDAELSGTKKRPVPPPPG
jgi:glyoxylase-like metal-dependent hydrolase (beta-lactamase superfamily II)